MEDDGRQKEATSGFEICPLEAEDGTFRCHWLLSCGETSGDGWMEKQCAADSVRFYADSVRSGVLALLLAQG